MNRKAFEVFGNIHAEEDLKQKTASYLRAQIKQRAGKKKIRALRAAAFCMSLMLFFLCGGLLVRAYFTPVAYIDFDVNPSVEFRINRFGRVIASHAYNDDGQELLEYIRVKYLAYDEAAGLLLGAMQEEGYFGQDTLLCVTVQTDGKEREGDMLACLREIVAGGYLGEKEDTSADISADVYAVTKEVKHCAQEHQISPAKYLAIEELIAVDPEADFEECKGHSVHELREMTREKCGDGGHQENHGQEEHKGAQEQHRHGQEQEQEQNRSHGHNGKGHHR